MPTNPQEFSDLLGAKYVGEVPDVGGGPFGMARLARIMHARLTPSQGERPGRPTDPSWGLRLKVPLSEATYRTLAALAEGMSTPARRVSAMQLAAPLLEEAVERVEREAPGTAEELPHDLASSAGAKAEPSNAAAAGQSPGRSPRLTDADEPEARTSEAKTKLKTRLKGKKPGGRSEASPSQGPARRKKHD